MPLGRTKSFRDAGHCTTSPWTMAPETAALVNSSVLFTNTQCTGNGGGDRQSDVQLSSRLFQNKIQVSLPTWEALAISGSPSRPGIIFHRSTPISLGHPGLAQGPSLTLSVSVSPVAHHNMRLWGLKKMLKRSKSVFGLTHQPVCVCVCCVKCLLEHHQALLCPPVCRAPKPQHADFHMTGVYPSRHTPLCRFRA